MKGLLVKDYRLMMQQKNFFVMMLVFVIIMDISFSAAFSIVYMTIMCGMFALSTISYDEFDKSVQFLFTMPVSRKTYAVEKYVFGILVSLAACMIAVILLFVFDAVRGQNIPIGEECQNGMAGFLASAIFMDLALPFQLKYGSEKGKNIRMLVLVAVIALGYLVSQKTQHLGLDFTGLIQALSRIPDGVIVALIVILSVVITWISCRISVQIVEKKEF